MIIPKEVIKKMNKFIAILCSLLLSINLFPTSTFANVQDTKKPVVEQIEMITKTVKKNESAKIKIKVTDDLSGVYAIKVVFKSPSNLHATIATLVIDEVAEDDTYILTTGVINEFSEPGIWKASYVEISDKSWNTGITDIPVGLNSLGLNTIPMFEVINGSEVDTSPPVLEDIQLVTQNITTKEPVKFNVKVKDNLSGVASIYISFISPSKQDGIFAELKITEKSKYYIYTLTTNAIDEFAELGTWYVDFISLTDHTDNGAQYSYGYDYNYQKEPIIKFDVKSSLETPTDNDFNVWDAKYNIEKNKKWTVKFALPFDPATISEHQNLYVADSEGNIVNTSFIIDNTSPTGTALDASSVTILPPYKGYAAGEKYTLYIKNVKGKNGETLKQFVKMDFTIKTDNNTAIEIN